MMALPDKARVCFTDKFLKVKISKNVVPMLSIIKIFFSVVTLWLICQKILWLSLWEECWIGLTGH